MRPDGPTILVTDAARGSALAMVRSLGRAGYRVVAADSDRGAPGLHSRHAVKARLYPSPEASATALCNSLHQLVRDEGVDLLLPVTDLVVHPLAAERARFEAVTRLAIPSQPALTIANDKLATLELARQIGVRIPPTVVVEKTSDLAAAGCDLGWPVVFKPQSSKRIAAGAGVQSFEVAYAHSETELRQMVDEIETGTPVILQRWVPGTGHGIGLLMNEGRPLAAFQHRRLREIPVTGGASAYRESVRLDPEMYELSVRMLAALNWTGLAMVEFRVGKAGTYLMEINGRAWGSLPLAVASGVDFPLLLARLHLDGEKAVDAPPIGRYRLGVRRRDLQRDAAWIAQVLAGRRSKPQLPQLPFPRRRAAVAAILGWLDPRACPDQWAWDDPQPALFEWPRAVRKLWLKKGRLFTDTLSMAIRSGTL